MPNNDGEIMLDDTSEELVLPPTLAETKDALSALIGDITELRTWVRLQYEGRKNGLRVDWDQMREKQDEIAALQGDIEALKKHASGFRADAADQVAIAKAEKERLKLDRQKLQKEIERQAMDAKNDRRVKAAKLQARRESAAMTAVDRYIKEHCPEHLAAVRAVVSAVRLATT